MPWSTLFNRRVVFDAIEMTDWQMYVEYVPDGRHNFPRFTRPDPRGQSAWTTTLAVRAARTAASSPTRTTARRGATVARNLDVTVARPASEYRGQASFSDGTVKIQNYVPMRADMTHDVPDRRRQGRARPDRPADRRRPSRSSPAKWT